MNLLKVHPAADDFAFHSGKLLQNFGVVELDSCRWVAVLSNSDIAGEISAEVTLSKRIEIILKLLERAPGRLAPEDDAKARTHWKVLRDKGCDLRNTVAHGALALAFDGADTGAPPSVSGILKRKKWGTHDELMSVEELKDAVTKTAAIVEQLRSLLERL